MDLAVGVIIGAASSIVDSLANEIIMPVVGLMGGGTDFTNLFEFGARPTVAPH